MNPLLPNLTQRTPTAKCTVTHGLLPPYIDIAQPPHKRAPFSTLRNIKWSHHIDVLLPQPLAPQLQSQFARPPLDDTSDGVNTPGERRPHGVTYAKVMLKLSDVLTGELFTAYVKTGRVAMRSEGRKNIDDVFWLCDGLLTLQLTAPTYTRTGLTGRPIPSGGKKHEKSRWEVGVDLRDASMRHGKKGFDRLMRAARTALDESRVWLVAQTTGVSRDASTTTPKGLVTALEPFHPLWKTVSPLTHELNDVQVPSTALLDDTWRDGDADKDDLADVHEYLALLALDAPRVHADDEVDPYICRYRLPASDPCAVRDAGLDTQTLVRLRWQGFLPCDAFVLELMTGVKKVLERCCADGGALEGGDSREDQGVISRDGEGGHRARRQWAAVMLHGFDGEHTTLLLRNQKSKNADAARDVAAAKSTTRADEETGQRSQNNGNSDGKAQNNHKRKRDDGETTADDIASDTASKTSKQGDIAFTEWRYQD